MADRPQRVSIGFAGGPVLSARLPPAELDRLRAALRGGAGGWHEALSDDGTLMIELGTVAYLQVDHDEARVGFGA